ncbi:MAG: RNA polymerase sigma factor [Chthoniobacterales bacterium]
MEKEGSQNLSDSLPQLYRFCFLMTGQVARALEAFQNTVREAALLASKRQLPSDRLWAFHEARHQCLSTGNPAPMETASWSEETISPESAARAEQMEGTRLADWISTAPEPQRSALALYYLNEFSHREMQNLLDLKMSELATLISHGRARFQALLRGAPATP